MVNEQNKATRPAPAAWWMDKDQAFWQDYEGRLRHIARNPINSAAWWDEFFLNLWDIEEGDDQSRYFMEQVLAHLPVPELEYLRTHPLSVLDWGCAKGIGAVLLQRAFPQSLVKGLDVSPTAITKAHALHPECEFILESDGKIPGEFDVIVTSNVLEHFVNPLEVMATHFPACRQFYVALVPFKEQPLEDYHFCRFDETSFPEYINTFRRIHTAVFETDPNYWRGEQVLVVYASAAYTRERTAQ